MDEDEGRHDDSVIMPSGIDHCREAYKVSSGGSLPPALHGSVTFHQLAHGG
jgi:hypothetical protein